MRRTLSWLTLTVVWSLLAVPFCLALDEVTFEALVDKKVVTADENVQYLVRVHYAFDTMVPSITPPSFGQFSIINEYQSTQEAGTGPDRHRVLKRIWLLRPEETGHLSIAASIITYQDPTTNLLKTGRTEIQFVNVSPTAEPAAQAGPAPLASRTRGFGWQWGAVALGALALVLSVTLRRRSRPVAPRRLPEEAALQTLDQAVAHLEQENLDQYYVVLTRALMEYLQTKFGLDAEALATPALLERLGRLGFTPAILQGLERFLRTAEKAKFAGYVPEETEMVSLHQILQDFFTAGRALTPRSAPPSKGDRLND